MNSTNNSEQCIVTVNAGSSSIKLAVFTARNTQKIAEAAIENIGQPSASLTATEGNKPVAAPTHTAAAAILMEWLQTRITGAAIIAVGHRMVHGGPNYYEAQMATDDLLAELRTFTAFDPEHLPVELELVATFRTLLPHVQQVACFDTAFHHDLPPAAKLLAIPRKLSDKGVRRYGFHGLSYAYIVEELRRVEGDVAARGKVVIAHLGSGASLVALRDGKPVDTTMSMTPASGIPMSTRSGDLDPGLALYLARTENYDAKQFNRMANFESGLLGISEATGDMKKLLEMEDANERAKDAIDIFCYQAKKTIGSYAAALGGLNTLVFTGGMGENAPEIRRRICAGLEFLGVTLDAARNEAGARLISTDGTRVGVHVIHTDEAVTIAQETARLIQRT